MYLGQQKGAIWVSIPGVRKRAKRFDITVILLMLPQITGTPATCFKKILFLFPKYRNSKQTLLKLLYSLARTAKYGIELIHTAFQGLQVRLRALES